MGVYIKGMEMPNSCRDCMLEQPYDGYNCGINGKAYNWGIEGRPSDCPLIEVPSADVVEVKTAHWVRMSEKEVFGEINMQCSECAFDDWRTPSYWKTWGNFCPNCGARMDGE